MKYMGSKRWMLKNGLGKLIRRETKSYDRFVDLFCGGGSVAWFVASETDLPVYACDLQQYAVVLAESLISRCEAVQPTDLWNKWNAKVLHACTRSVLWEEITALALEKYNIKTWSYRARILCAQKVPEGCAIWKAYGGYYFSPLQALTIDYMLASLPDNKIERSICLASCLISASMCAAAPGHTAQPFKSSGKAGKYLRESWCRSPLDYARRAMHDLAPKHARTSGLAKVADALDVATELSSKDLVFIDPPYSGVHYSRFYHVLETIARGDCGSVSGNGRYPPAEERPVSCFSRKSESGEAISLLLERVASAGSTALLTFPDAVCSNGLSGEWICEKAERWFHIEIKKVSSKLSTLGGNGSHRAARHEMKELILLLKPKGSRASLQKSRANQLNLSSLE